MRVLHRPSWGSRGPWVAAALLLSSTVLVPPASGQSFRGSTASTAGGIALGMYSGATLGLIGSLLPCNRTLNGGRCAASGASVGGSLGVAMGGLIGAQNQDEIFDRLENAGVGAIVGAAVGVALRRAVRQYQWTDAVTVAAIGAGLGAVPRGSGLGAGAGAVTGALVWAVFPRAGFPDFVVFTLAGTALGGMLEWAEGAATAKRDLGSGPGIATSFSFSVR